MMGAKREGLACIGWIDNTAAWEHSDWHDLQYLPEMVSTLHSLV